MNLLGNMEGVNFVDLSQSSSEDEFSSFGSQETDDDSVIVLVEAADVSSDDENVEDVDIPDDGDMVEELR